MSGPASSPQAAARGDLPSSPDNGGSTTFYVVLAVVYIVKGTTAIKLMRRGQRVEHDGPYV
jgi:hypothetical protein